MLREFTVLEMYVDGKLEGVWSGDASRVGEPLEFTEGDERYRDAVTVYVSDCDKVHVVGPLSKRLSDAGAVWVCSVEKGPVFGSREEGLISLD